jgi:hypothetical protein
MALQYKLRDMPFVYMSLFFPIYLLKSKSDIISEIYVVFIRDYLLDLMALPAFYNQNLGCYQKGQLVSFY